MLQRFFGVLVLILSVSTTVQAQYGGYSSSNRSFFSKNQKFDVEGIELYDSNLDLKRHKRFGMGVSLGGANGVLGLNTELNLDPENALVLGLGTGPGYGTINMLWKYNYESRYLSPYTKLGYSKWFRAGRGVAGGGATESEVLRRVYSDQDLRAGRFDADFLVTGLGAEYNQLEGEMAGVNFYGEVLLMSELKTARVVPTGAVGMIYFY